MFGRNGETGGALQTVGNFHIGIFQVTQGQWYEVMPDNPRPSFFTGTNAATHWGAGGVPSLTLEQDELPVERVSWYDALVFANRLSIRDGLRPAYRINDSTDPDIWGEVPTTSTVAWNNVVIVDEANGWRLPTEYQWEFAAKGGRLSVGHGGRVGDPPANTGATETHTYLVFSGSNTATEVAWHGSNSGNQTRPVGSLQANELGLYDMSGNVSEWMWDIWPHPIAARVVRGGSWVHWEVNTRSVHRYGLPPVYRGYFRGFRLVRS